MQTRCCAVGRIACHKRARPIVMTTVAMIAGMLPIALGLGADASFRQPMAIAVIGGLITSTLLRLVIVPAVYSYVHDFEAWLARRFMAPRATGEPAHGPTTAQKPSGTPAPKEDIHEFASCAHSREPGPALDARGSRTTLHRRDSQVN